MFATKKMYHIPDDYKERGTCWRCSKKGMTYLSKLGVMKCKKCLEREK